MGIKWKSVLVFLNINLLLLVIISYSVINKQNNELSEYKSRLEQLNKITNDTSLYWISVVKNTISKYNNTYTEKELLSIAVNWYSYCKEYNEDILMTLSVAQLESHMIYWDGESYHSQAFDKNAVSVKGAIGFYQLMPETAKQLANELRIPYDRSINFNYNILDSIESNTTLNYNQKRMAVYNEIVDYASKNPNSIEAKLFDPKNNIKLGIYYLSKLRKQGLNDFERLVVYNIGIGNYLNGKYLISGKQYYEKVNSIYEKLKGTTIGPV